MSQWTLLIDFPGLEVDDLNSHLSANLTNEECDAVSVFHGAMPNRTRGLEAEILAAIIEGSAAVLAAVILAVASLASDRDKRFVILLRDERIPISTDADKAMIQRITQQVPDRDSIVLLAEDADDKREC